MILAGALSLLVASAAAAPCSGPAPCSSAEDPALRAAVAPLLGAIDRPVPPEAWRRLPPGARAHLEALAGDRERLPTRRARALEGVAALGADGSLHRRLAEDPAEPFLVRHAALRGLGALLPPADARTRLARLMTADGDARMRAAAALVLARASPAEGCPAVRTQARREAAPGGFQRALAACGDR